MEEVSIFNCAVEQSLRDLELDFKLRPKQIEAVESIYRSKDTLVLLPTSSGKTLIFQILPSLFANIHATDHCSYSQHPIIIIVSPLLALMQDQLISCERLKIPALKLDSSNISLKSVREGNFNILLSSPEFWLSTSAKKLLCSPIYKKNVFCIVVDECHHAAW